MNIQFSRNLSTRIKKLESHVSTDPAHCKHDQEIRLFIMPDGTVNRYCERCKDYGPTGEKRTPIWEKI